MSFANTTSISETEQAQRPAPGAYDSKQQSIGKKFAIAAAKLLNDSNCSDILVFDVRSINPLTNYLIIATGTSDRQLKAVSQYVKELALEYDMESYASESDEKSKWLIEDFVDVIVHLFEPQTRVTYDLEMLWGDGEKIDWEK